MKNQNQIGERDRDRALIKLRWLTAFSGIAAFVAAALGTSAAAQASTPSPAVRADPAPGSLSAEQLAALNFALPKPSTIVVWQTPGRAAAPNRAPASGPAPAAAPAPRPAPVPPPPPVATTGTS